MSLALEDWAVGEKLVAEVSVVGCLPLLLVMEEIMAAAAAAR
jgi:hypothetical protein